MIDWKKVLPAGLADSIVNRQAWLNVMRLGTLHPNGYFRERCMRILEEDEESFGYIVLRLNGWVRQVRETAYGILADKLDDTFYQLYEKGRAVCVSTISGDRRKTV